MDSTEENERDSSIVWENPDTPANADDYIFINDGLVICVLLARLPQGMKEKVKRRWAGKIIVELYADEFKGRPLEYYVRAVQTGRIRVEGARVSPSFVVRDSQKMSHFVHRHEPPVIAGPIKILEEGPDVITVCKPPSIPVHPCGQYRKNTVVGILEAEHKTGQLFPIHRLDRLVSGLLILARNAQTANRFGEEIAAGRVYKEYLAKVKGVFPADEVEVNAAVIYDPREGISTVETGPSGVGKGKVACTRFQRLSTDGVCSIVRCEPVTGRTHQIRVHLQHLGHPIANDDLYLQAHPPKRSREGVNADTAAKSARTIPSNSPLIVPEESSTCTTTTASVRHISRSPESKNSAVDSLNGDTSRISSDSIEETRQLHNIEGVSSDSRKTPMDADVCSEHDNIGHSSTESSSERTKVETTDQIEGTGQLFLVDSMCTHCPDFGPSGYENDEEGLWLHCIRYASPSWSYECPLADWAL